jgi:hypothetical protein
MANKVLLKKSSTAAKVPLVTDLDYGELALNYTDGKLYYKTASNTIKSFTEDSSVVTLTGTQTLTNKTLTAPVIDNIKLGYATTATGNGTTTLTVTSAHQQFFTGTLNQTIVLPVTSTLVTGISYSIENNSTGILTVQSSGANTIATIPAGVTAFFTVVATNTTTAADWDFDYVAFATITGTGSAVLSASPALTGTPTAPTATAGDVSTQIATTAFADTVALNKAVAMAIALG